MSVRETLPISVPDAVTILSDAERTAALLEKDRRYCSYGDTVHYADPPKIFTSCDGSYLFDGNGIPYLDLQMWYSAVNFGYRNRRLNNALKQQIDTLPQLACQYLHAEKVDLAESLCKVIEERTGLKGRVQFNVGGAQAVEDALKLVRNTTGKNLNFAFMGGYHGRTLGASAITSSYRYRRRYGHFSDRAQFIPFPYCFRCPYDMKRESCGLHCVKQFERLFDTEYHSVWDSKAGESEFAAFFGMDTSRSCRASCVSAESFSLSMRSRWASIARANSGRSSISA